MFLGACLRSVVNGAVVADLLTVTAPLIVWLIGEASIAALRKPRRPGEVGLPAQAASRVARIRIPTSNLGRPLPVVVG